MRSVVNLYAFPISLQERIYCFLSDGFRNNFCNKLLKKYGTIVNISKKYKISEDIIRGWRTGRNIRGISNRIIPIKCSLLFKIGKDIGYSKSILQKSITGLKTKGARSTILIDPVLPIKFNYSLGRLIGCSLGDGHLNKCSTIVYANTSKKLINELTKCVNNVGNIRVSIKKYKDCYILIIPNIIGIILEYFDVPTGSKVSKKHSVKLPKFVFDAPLDFRMGIISGLMDDEGSVIKDGKIKFKQALPELVSDLKRLLNDLDIITSKRLIDGSQYYFCIYRKSERLKVRNINVFKHPSKIDRLDKIIRSDMNGRN
jgi:hypothetical protein